MINVNLAGIRLDLNKVACFGITPHILTSGSTGCCKGSKRMNESLVSSLGSEAKRFWSFSIFFSLFPDSRATALTRLTRLSTNACCRFKKCSRCLYSAGPAFKAVLNFLSTVTYISLKNKVLKNSYFPPNLGTISNSNLAPILKRRKKSNFPRSQEIRLRKVNKFKITANFEWICTEIKAVKDLLFLINLK